MARNQSPLERGVMEDSHSSPNSNRRGFFDQKTRNLAAFGIRKYRSNKGSKISKEVGLTLMSGYFGSLLPGEQRKYEKIIGLEPGTFTKYNSSRFYAGWMAGKYIPIFATTHFVPGDFDDKGALIELGVSLAINGFRYVRAKKKGEAWPAISGLGIATNLLHYAGKGISRLRSRK